MEVYVCFHVVLTVLSTVRSDDVLTTSSGRLLDVATDAARHGKFLQP